MYRPAQGADRAQRPASVCRRRGCLAFLGDSRRASFSWALIGAQVRDLPPAARRQISRASGGKIRPRIIQEAPRRGRSADPIGLRLKSNLVQVRRSALPTRFGALLTTAPPGAEQDGALIAASLVCRLDLARCFGRSALPRFASACPAFIFLPFDGKALT